MDAHSGQTTVTPMLRRTKDAVYLTLKHFVGVEAAKKLPTLIVKSDADKAITGAVAELGWMSEPSLERRWPHNTRQERVHGILKGCARAALVQSGLPLSTWHVALQLSLIHI